MILRPLATDSITLVMFFGIPVHFEIPECLSVIKMFEFKLWMAPCSRNLFIHMAMTDLPRVVAILQLKRLLKSFGCPDKTEFWPKFPDKRPSVYPYTEKSSTCKVASWDVNGNCRPRAFASARGLFFCKLWLIMRDCFHTETSVVKNVPIFVHFL